MHNPINNNLEVGAPFPLAPFDEGYSKKMHDPTYDPALDFSTPHELIIRGDFHLGLWQAVTDLAALQGMCLSDMHKEGIQV